MQAVVKFYKNNPDVLGNGKKHFAERLSHALDSAVFQFAELGHAVNKKGDILAEFFSDVFDRDAGFLGGVMEDGGGHRRGIKPQIGQIGGDSKWMGNIRLAGFSIESRMDFIGEEKRALDN